MLRKTWKSRTIAGRLYYNELSMGKEQKLVKAFYDYQKMYGMVTHDWMEFTDGWEYRIKL